MNKSIIPRQGFRCIIILGFAGLCAAATHAGEVSGELSRKPWSGSFWPLRKAWAAFGNWGQNLAPFEKYDNYVSLTTGKNPGSAAREADPANGHNEAPVRDGENWTGHCHGWAPAALLEAEPPVEVTIQFDRAVSFLKLKTADATSAKSGLSRDRESAYGTRPGGTDKALELSTADLKGMYTEIYCETKSTFYGTRYNGRQPDRNSAAYMDVKPHLMHQLLVKFVKDKDQGLVFDVDPSYMVWNQPIYKFDSRWTEEGDKLAVTTTIHWANDNGVDPNFHGLESVSRTYTYTMKKDAGGNIVDSEWTGKSLDDHPDFIWQPYGVVNGANMPGLDLEVVHEMVASDGKTVAVKNAGPGASNGVEEGNGENREENRRNLFERMRDGLRRVFNRG